MHFRGSQKATLVKNIGLAECAEFFFVFSAESRYVCKSVVNAFNERGITLFMCFFSMLCPTIETLDRDISLDKLLASFATIPNLHSFHFNFHFFFSFTLLLARSFVHFIRSLHFHSCVYIAFFISFFKRSQLFSPIHIKHEGCSN